MVGCVNLGGGVGIKSIQSGTHSFYSGTANKNIEAVNKNNSIVIAKVFDHSGAFTFSRFPCVYLTSDTNLKFDALQLPDSSGKIMVFWQVIEFSKNAIKSIQHKLTTGGSGAYRDTAISAIDKNKSVVFSTFSVQTPSDSGVLCSWASYLTSNNNLRDFTDTNNISKYKISSYIVEFR